MMAIPNIDPRDLPLSLETDDIGENLTITTESGWHLATIHNFHDFPCADGEEEGQTLEDVDRAAIAFGNLFIASAEMYEALEIAAGALCSAVCPSVKKANEEWTHRPECMACQAALAKARGKGK